jgi:hypothetical protein
VQGAIHRTVRRLWPGLLLFAILAGFYWKLTLTLQYEWIRDYDLGAQVLPWFEVEARQMHALTFPTWDPYLWAGQPLLAQDQPGAAYPLNWILFALPLRDGHIMHAALEWYFVAIRFLAALFAYLLCRDLGRSRVASIAGGIAFSLSGYLATTGWPQMANGAIWLPLEFLFLLRAVRGRNTVGSAALSGLFLGMAWLSGHHQIPLFSTLALAGAWLFFVFRKGGLVRPDARLVRAFAVAMVFAGLVGALQILPAYEYGHLARRWVGTPEPLRWDQPVPYSVHEGNALKAYSLLGTVLPGVRSNSDAFVGVVALALALLAIGAFWRDAAVRLMTALALGAMLYALGTYTAFAGFLYGLLPGIEKARTPAHAIVVFQFGVAVLAAFGLDCLGAADRPAWGRRVAWGAAGFGALTLAVAEGVLLANRLNFPMDDHIVVTGVFALLLAALLFAAGRGALSVRQAGVLAVLLLVAELSDNPVPTIASRADAGAIRPMEQMRANRDIADFLRKQPGFYRANIADSAFPANWGAYHGVEMWGGALASVTSNLLNFEFHKYQARMAYGVAYSIAAQPPAEPAEPIFDGRSGLKVYRHPEALPRAWAVHNLTRVPDMDAGNRWIVDRTQELRGTAFLLSDPPPVERCAGADTVELYDHRSTTLAIRAILPCTGMVILSDTYFPGWRAYVDGRRAKVWEVNGAMRGVVVPTGLHTVAMRYRPASVLWGGIGTLLGIAGAVWLARRKTGQGGTKRTEREEAP